MTKLGQILLTIWRITRLFLKGVSLLSYKCSYSIILSRIFFPPPPVAPPGCSPLHAPVVSRCNYSCQVFARVHMFSIFDRVSASFAS